MAAQLIIYTDSDGNPVVQIAPSDVGAGTMRRDAEEEKKDGTEVRVIPIGDLASEAEVKMIESLLQLTSAFNRFAPSSIWYDSIETLLCIGARIGLKSQG